MPGLEEGAGPGVGLLGGCWQAPPWKPLSVWSWLLLTLEEAEVLGHGRDLGQKLCPERPAGRLCALKDPGAQ